MGMYQFVAKASLGIAVYPVDGAIGDLLIRNADAAMYRAKRTGSGCAFYDKTWTESA